MFIQGFTKTAGHLWDVSPEKGLHAKSDIHPRSNLGIAAKGDKITDLGKHVKHSDKPNLSMKVSGRSHLFEANQFVPQGAELTVDYNTVPHLTLHHKTASGTEEPSVSCTLDDVEADYKPEVRAALSAYREKVRRILRRAGR